MKLETPPLNTSRKKWYMQLVGYLIAAALGLLAGAIFILVIGENPLTVYRILVRGAFGSFNNIIISLRWSIPIILLALAVSFAYRAGIFNIGVEGQLFLGALAGALAGIYLTGLGVFHLPAALMLSALAGGLFALIPALLRVYSGVDEIVTTLMMDYVALYLTDFLVLSYFLPEGAMADIATSRIASSAILPAIFPPHPFNYGFILVILLCIICFYIFRRTVPGYQMNIRGISRRFADYGGLPASKIALISFIISGMIAGFAGGIEVLGAHHRFISRFGRGLGMDGILVALLGKGHPLGVIGAGIFYAGLKNGGIVLERTIGIDRSIAVVIQAAIIIFITAQYLLENYFVKIVTAIGNREG